MEQARTARPRLLVVSCGGTISSVRSGGTGVTPRLDAGQLLADVPQIAELADVDARTFSVVPSPHLGLDDVLRLRAEILAWLDALPVGARAGVVVTSGTDTLEEVAFALDLTWDRATPIVVTGAMRNASSPGPDGPANILAAAVTAVSPAARGLGVLVVLNDQIHAARHVRKTHTSTVATFQSPTVGPLGYIVEASARVVFVPRERVVLAAVPESVAERPVALVKIGIGDDGRLLAHLAGLGYRGVVLEGLGGGHVTREIAEDAGLDELIDAMPVVLCARVGAGEALRATYDFVGSETDLLARGVLSGGSLDGPKARVLLTLLLASGLDRPALSAAFARHVV